MKWNICYVSYKYLPNFFMVNEEMKRTLTSSLGLLGCVHIS